MFLKNGDKSFSRHPYGNKIASGKMDAPSVLPSSVTLAQSKLIAIIPTTQDYRLTFDITPREIVGDWASILHFTLTDNDCCSPGDRVPGIWFVPNSLYLHIRVGDMTEGNFGFDSVGGCAVGKTSRIVLECNGSNVTLSIDGTVSRLRQPTRRPDGKARVYAGDKFYRAANASIQNLSYGPVLDLDVLNPPNTPPNTWNEMNKICADKGKRLCTSGEMCFSNEPIPRLNVFGGADNWMAVSDKPNEWVTYATFDNRKCKTHTQVAGTTPGWGNTKTSYNFYRAAKCCPK